MGIDSRNRILLYHLEGLLNIITKVENGQVPKTVVVSGTSYFFNEKTVNRLGFEYENPSLFYRINFLVNFIDLTWMYSLSQEKSSIPKVWKAKKAIVTASNLLNRKELLMELHRKIAVRISDA